MLRRPDDCLYRAPLGPQPNRAEACCELLARLSGVREQTIVAVDRQACEACCRFEMPTEARPTPVIASLAYSIARRIIESGPIDDCDANRAQALRGWALRWMETVFSAQSPTLENLVHRTVSADTLTNHLQSRMPFVYLRYGDGEWCSVLGAQGFNCDRHDFFPETMGRELQSVLSEVGQRSGDGRRIYVGTTTCFLQREILEYIGARRLADRIEWVSDALLRSGLHDLSTRRFVEVVAAHAGPKWLVANRHLQPVARALGLRHAIVSEHNCYLQLDAIEAMLQFDGPGLVLCCASMASECLIWRLFRENPDATYVDCGSIFDWMIGRENRPEACVHHDLLQREYSPIFRDYI